MPRWPMADLRRILTRPMNSAPHRQVGPSGPYATGVNPYLSVITSIMRGIGNAGYQSPVLNGRDQRLLAV